MKVKKLQSKKKTPTSNPHMSHKALTAFNEIAQRFEKQRSACEPGLAFTFTEGALVDKIQTGKWYVCDHCLSNFFIWLNLFQYLVLHLFFSGMYCSSF
jgi:midasin (ATPase involved in ribosome maturation)